MQRGLQAGRVDLNVRLHADDAIGRNGAGNGKPDAEHLGRGRIGLGEHLADAIRYRVITGLVHDGRRRHATLANQGAVLQEQADLDGRAAHIEAYVQFLGLCHDDSFPCVESGSASRDVEVSRRGPACCLHRRTVYGGTLSPRTTLWRTALTHR